MMNEVKVKWIRYLFRVCFLSLSFTLMSFYWSCSLGIDEGHVEIVSEFSVLFLILVVGVTFVGNSTDDDDTDYTADNSDDHSSVWGWWVATDFKWFISSVLPSIPFFMACVMVSSSFLSSSGSFVCFVACSSSF